MKLAFCSNCNYKLDSEVCKNCFMAVNSDDLIGTDLCKHYYRMPSEDDKSWTCLDCNETRICSSNS